MHWSLCSSVFCYLCFFFFKQKTAYEMRISDWSSDVCSSDLPTETIRPLRISTVAPSIGCPPLPVATLPPVIAIVCAIAGTGSNASNAAIGHFTSHPLTRLAKLEIGHPPPLGVVHVIEQRPVHPDLFGPGVDRQDRKSTRLNSSH